MPSPWRIITDLGSDGTSRPGRAQRRVLVGQNEMASERSDGLGLERLFGSLGAGSEEPVLLWRARGGTLACDTVTGAREWAVAWVSCIYNDVLSVGVCSAYVSWVVGWRLAWQRAAPLTPQRLILFYSHIT